MDTIQALVFSIIAVTAISASRGIVSFFPTGADVGYPQPTENSLDGTKINPPNPVDENEFPFFVYLKTVRYPHLCSASLIERRWVLTAAHCIITTNITVVLGTFNRQYPTGLEQTIEAAEIIRHPEYDGINFTSDIALIRLETPADIKPESVGKVAPLASGSYMEKVLNNEKKCLVLGMGVTRYGNVWASSDVIQQQQLSFLTDEEAAVFTYTPHPTVVYAEGIYKDECEIASVCSGDSGGPVVCKKGGDWVQVGITSFGYLPGGCMTGGKGFANVQYLQPWIESVIG